MQTVRPLLSVQERVIKTTRQLFQQPAFCQRHRSSDQHFTRRRVLTFMNVVVFLLQKTVRSLQLHLHDFFEALGQWSEAVTASAWSQARLKLRHTAFIELNERAVLEEIYRADSGFAIRRWKGHRLLGIDSSLVRLPNESGIGQEFGWVNCTNNQGECGRYPQGRLSALTDLLNRIVVQAFFVPWTRGERALAAEHVAALAPGDIGILDRGFAAFELFAQFVTRQRWFVCRCATHSFGAVNQLFRENQAGRSVICQLRPPHKPRARLGQAGLPERITIRLVTVRLSTGELEVLATHLLDEPRYPTADFAELYHCRWGMETYYGLLKGRLDLENLTGRTPEALRQDVYATVFLSNLESVLTRPAQEQLEAPSEPAQHRQQVNHAVGFHALKSQIIALRLNPEPLAQVVAKLQQWFLANPVTRRPQRIVPRKKPSAWRSYHYQRTVRKTVF